MVVAVKTPPKPISMTISGFAEGESPEAKLSPASRASSICAAVASSIAPVSWLAAPSRAFSWQSFVKPTMSPFAVRPWSCCPNRWRLVIMFGCISRSGAALGSSSLMVTNITMAATFHASSTSTKRVARRTCWITGGVSGPRVMGTSA